MAIVLESTSATAIASGASVVITKPTGLTVGDLMLAFITSPARSGPPSANGIACSGWTFIVNQDYSASATTIYYAVAYKVADSSDVAASNFTFTHATYGLYMGGAILRLSGYGLTDDTAVISSTSASPATVTSNITPAWANSFAFAFLNAGLNSTDTPLPGFSAPSLATDNPTWTERATSNIDIGLGAYGYSLYTASRTAATAWGNMTVTYSAPANSDVVGLIGTLAPKIDGTHTVTTSTHYFVNQPFLRTGAIDVDGIDPTTNSMSKPIWTPVSKNTTTWTPNDK